MKKVTCTICLLLMLLSGCAERVGNLPLLPNEIGVFPLMTPGIYLVMKNVNEANAMMRVERETLAEDMQRKNPVYFIKGKATILDLSMDSVGVLAPTDVHFELEPIRR